MLKFLCKRDVLPRCTYGIKVSLYSTNQIPNPIQVSENFLTSLKLYIERIFCSRWRERNSQI